MQEKVNIFIAYVYNIRMDVIFQKDSNSPVAKKNNFKTKVIAYFKNYNSGFYFFLFLVAIGLAFFISSLWENQFTTLFGGDYTAQQLPFYTNGYDDWWHFFRTGQFRYYSTNTYLGASNIGANSFYYLFDPFFFPILLCPRAYIAQGMAILTIFKIAGAGMVFRKYMRVMGASEKASRITALAYAFSGWMAWFLWFNHMTEVMICFPLMLWGVEKVLREKKPWLLMFACFLMGITNYFFLIGMGIAAFFYAIFRYFQRLKLYNAKNNLIILGLGFIGFFAGILMSCAVVFPNILYSLDAPRAANSSYLDNLIAALKDHNFGKFIGYIFSWKMADGREFKHFYPLASFVFPCASCRGTPLTQWGNEWYDNCATNTYSFLPMLLLFLPAFIKAMKEKKWSAIVATVLFIWALETPFCYYMFFGFTAPYGRWELFFVSSFLTFTGLYIDKVKDEPIWTDICGYVFAIICAIGGGICASNIVEHYDLTDKFQYRGDGMINATGATLIVCAVITVEFIALLFTKKKEVYKKIMTGAIAIEAVVMGYLTIQGHWCQSFINCNNGLKYNNEIYRINTLIGKTDKSYHRVWTYNQNESSRNDGMRNAYNGLGCFHSLYNFNVSNFVHWTRIQDGSPFGVNASWSGCYVWKNADLDKFLGVKYYYIQSNSPQWGWMGDNQIYQYNVPLEYREVKDVSSNIYAIFKDRNYKEASATSGYDGFAFAYDKLISYDLKEGATVESCNEDMPSNSARSCLRNSELVLEGAILESSVANKIKEENPSFELEQARNIRTLEKRDLTSVDVKMFDLHKPLLDDRKCTVYTFFEPGENSWMGDVHALTSEQLVTIDEGRFEEVSSADPDNDQYGRYVTTFTPRLTSTFENVYEEDGYAIYIPYNYSDELQADIYLIDENNKIITWDRHQDDKYNEGGLRYRSFYVHPKSYNEDGSTKEPAPKLKKIIIAQRNQKAMYKSEFMICYEKYSSQKNRHDLLNRYPITDVKIGTSKYQFKSNFDKKTVIVTQLPFEKGFSVKAKTADGKTKNIEVISVQGGFAGFIGEIGETSYTMTFYPANLQAGKFMSAFGAFIFVSTFYGYAYIRKKKQTEEEEEEIRQLLSLKC